jgi:outer membrane protein insertion porin family
MEVPGDATFFPNRQLAQTPERAWMPGVRRVHWPWKLAPALLLWIAAVVGGTAWAQLPPGVTPAPTLPTLPSQEAQAQAFTPGQAPVVDVRIVGNRTVPLSKIVPHVRTRAGRPFEKGVVEADVRRLMSTKMFVKVNPYSRRVDDGVVVVFELLERPSLQYVKYLGNKRIKDKALAKETELKAGDPLDPIGVEDGRRKIEDYYHEKGFSKIRVTVLEGNKPEDHGAIFLINEGQKQRVLWTDFVGNTIADDGRLRTQIESKPGYFWFFKGEVDRKKIDEDIERLTAYYRGLGFFNAKVGRELQFTESQEWLKLTFVINEGPRYKVRSVSVLGNTKFNTEDLSGNLKLKGGDFFNQAQMNADVTAMQDKYGGIGYVFADVKADPRFLEDPGQLDLVYNITEGARYRVGEIRVNIEGDNPRTRLATIYNRLSLRPGDIVDTRKLRDSERRLQASGLFLADPAQGVKPKIVFSPPEVDSEPGGNKQKPQVARDPNRPPGFRGQSPDNEDRVVDLTLVGKLAPPEQWPPEEQLHTPMPAAVAPAPAVAAPAGTNPPVPASGEPQAVPTNFPPATLPAPSRPAVIVRGQYSPDAGYSTPTLNAGPNWSAPRTAPAPAYGAPPATAPAYNTAPSYSGGPGYSSAPSYNSTPSYSAAPNYAQAAPPLSAPVQQLPTQQVPQMTSPAPAGAYAGPAMPYAPPPAATPAPTAAPAAEPVPAGPPVGVNPPTGTAPAITQEGAWGAPVQQPLFPENSVFAPGSEEELTRPLPLDVIARETETGKLMIGAGINSDAGLFGQFVIDERNFSIRRWPRSFEDIRSGRAWRGDGQQLRLEAVPGTEYHRYMINFREPYLFDTEIGLLLSGYYFSRNYYEWDEERLGGRVGLIYQFSHDLSGTFSVRAENVKVFNPISATDPELTQVLGDNGLYGFEFKLAHDTRDSAFLPTQGHYIELSAEQVVGTFNYPRAEVDLRRHFTLHQRPDGSGRHVLSLNGKFMVSGNDTPIYEHYYFGGFSSLRGFDFRGVGPIDDYGVRVGGKVGVLASIEYMFPITADDMLRGVVFCDTGTSQTSIDQWSDAYRVAPGFGLRITIPAMGPAPIALDLAFPVSHQKGDDINNFSFFIGVGR